MMYAIRFRIGVMVPAQEGYPGFHFAEDEVVLAEIMPYVRKIKGEYIEMATIWTKDGRAGASIWFAWFQFL